MSILSEQIVDPLQLYSLQQNTRTRLSILEQGSFPQLGEVNLLSSVPDFRVRQTLNFNTPGIVWELNLIYSLTLPPVSVRDPDHPVISGPKVWCFYNAEVVCVLKCTAGTYQLPALYFQPIGAFTVNFDNPLVASVYQNMGMGVFAGMSAHNLIPAYPPMPAISIVADLLAGVGTPYVGTLGLVEENYGSPVPKPLVSFCFFNRIQTVPLPINYILTDKVWTSRYVISSVHEIIL